MIRTCSLALFLLAAACVSAGARQNGPPNAIAEADLAFTRVGVIDVTDGAVLPDRTVLIHVYPTYSESLKRGANAYVREKFFGGVLGAVKDLAGNPQSAIRSPFQALEAAHESAVNPILEPPGGRSVQ